MTAAHELWRRMRCNACAYGPAMANSAAPKSLAGAKALAGRYCPLKARTTAWCRDERYLWAAADNRLFQIDLARGALLRCYGLEDGLPDAPPDQLLSHAGNLWIAYRGGVAVLKIGSEKVADLPALHANFVRLCPDSRGVWVIADTGTWHLKDPGRIPPARAALPTAGRIARKVTAGIWAPIWKDQTAHFIPAAAH